MENKISIVIFEDLDGDRGIGVASDDGVVCTCCASFFETDEDCTVLTELPLDTEGISGATSCALNPDVRAVYLRDKSGIVSVAIVDVAQLSVYAQVKEGDRISLSGDSATLGIEDYNVRVSSAAIVDAIFDNNTLRVTVDEIDGDHNVCCCVKLKEMRWGE